MDIMFSVTLSVELSLFEVAWLFFRTSHDVDYGILKLFCEKGKKSGSGKILIEQNVNVLLILEI